MVSAPVFLSARVALVTSANSCASVRFGERSPCHIEPRNQSDRKRCCEKPHPQFPTTCQHLKEAHKWDAVDAQDAVVQRLAELESHLAFLSSVNQCVSVLMALVIKTSVECVTNHE